MDKASIDYNLSHRPKSPILISILIPIWQTIESSAAAGAVDEALLVPCSLSTSISQRTRHEFTEFIQYNPALPPSCNFFAVPGVVAIS